MQWELKGESKSGKKSDLIVQLLEESRIDQRALAETSAYMAYDIIDPKGPWVETFKCGPDEDIPDFLLDKSNRIKLIRLFIPRFLKQLNIEIEGDEAMTADNFIASINPGFVRRKPTRWELFKRFLRGE